MNAGRTDPIPPVPPSRSPLINAWRTLCAGNEQDSQVALAIAVIAVVGTIGCLAVFVYGVAARVCTGTDCEIALAGRSTGGLVALLAAAGAFAAGGMLGLLFGSPRWGETAPTPAPPAANGDAGGDAQAPVAGVRPNTSLERIADWLTTMIVGLGLANLATISEKLTIYGTWLTQAITNDTNAKNCIPGLVISLSFVFAGFLLVYLWSLRFLPSELNRAYDRLARVATQVAQQEIARKTGEIDRKTEELTQQIEVFRKQPVFAMAKDSIQRIVDELDRLGVDATTRDEVRQRYENAKTWDDEPMKDFGLSAVDGYALSAKVSPIMSKMYAYDVKLTVPAAANETDVIWLRHHTFQNVLVPSAIGFGAADHQGQTRGPFWIGVVIPRTGKEALRLAIDLAQADGATPDFLNEN